MAFEPEKETMAPKVPPPAKGKGVPHVVCTFQGTYYRGSTKGLEKVHYREAVKVPIRMIRDPNRSAIGIFRDIIGPRILNKQEGFSGVAYCQLVDSEELPEDLTLHKKIDYTGTHSGLSKIAKIHAPIVKPGLYITPAKLKHAIRLCLEDPKAFEALQEKQEGGLTEDHMIAEELESLGYL